MSYKLEVSDFDCYEGTTTLINKKGIRDEKVLRDNETFSTTYIAAELILHPLKPNFSFDDYREIHKQLFEEFYEWAGEPRKIGISKAATTFAAPEKIPELGKAIFTRLQRMNYFKDLTRADFIRETADLYHTLNMLHPFRDGNGRTQRVFFVQFIRNARYNIDYSALNSDILIIGTIQAASGVMDTLVQFFEDNITD